MNPIEPSADVRQAAHNLREVFVALLEQDFTQQQACAIVGTMLGQAIAGNQGDKDDP